MLILQRALLVLLAIAMLIAVHGGIVAGFDHHGWKPMSASDWGTWVGAVGTVGTLFGAIWIARSDVRRQEAIAIDAAILGAAAITTNVAACIEKLRSVVAELRLPIQDDGKFPPWNVWAERIKKPIFWDVDMLAPLLSIPGRPAAKLAMSRTWLFAFAQEMITEPQFDWDLQEMNIFNRDAADQIEAAIEFLESAHDQCLSFLEGQGFL
jgi:hypothetical protein